MPACERPEKFQSGNRTYHEVDKKHWVVKSNVFGVKAWLENRFIRYAKASKLSRHKHPERVRFGVLACEWAVSPPEAPRKMPVSPIKKGQNKRPFCEDHVLRGNRRLARPSLPASKQASAALLTNIPFQFGNKEGNDFEFTFEVSRK